jgi:hypothetical protein
MSIEHIVSLLIEERDRLEAAIAALQGGSSASELAIAPVVDAPESVMLDAKPAPAPRKKRKLSAAGRRRIVEATKARWARINAAKAASAARVAATPKAAPTKAPVVAKKKVSRKDAAYRTMMSERMKAAWAKRKKAAKK